MNKTASLSALLAAGWLTTGPAAEPPSGQALFPQYGCTNCHGARGIHPTSKYAPVLRGKPADYLLDQARAIFSGGGHLPAKKQMPQGLYATGTEAYKQLQALGAKGALIDVRTRAEVALLGTPTLSQANIPHVVVDWDEWDFTNFQFPLLHRRGERIIVGARS